MTLQLGAFQVASGLSEGVEAVRGGWQMTSAFLFNTHRLQKHLCWPCGADKEDIDFLFLVFANRQA